MKNAASQRPLLAASVAALLLGGCGARPRGEPADLAGLQWGDYPKAYRAVQRGRMRTDAGEVVFTGVMVVKPDGQAAYAALDDMGFKLFELAWKGGAVEVVRRMPQIPEAWLTRSAALDLWLIYRGRPGADFAVEAHRGGRRVTWDDAAAGEVTCDFSAEDGRWTEARRWRLWEGSTVTTLTDWGRVGEWTGDVPRHVETRFDGNRVVWDLVDLRIWREELP